MHWLHPSRLRERHDEVSTHKRRRFSRRFTVVGAGLLTALVFTIRGRGGRILLLTTAAAAVFLVISIAAAQLS